MRLPEEHLTGQEIDDLLEISPVQRDEDVAAAALHAQVCAQCRAVIEKHRGAAERLANLRTANEPPPERSSSCPGAERWAAYTAGWLDPGENEYLLSHLGECEYCAGLVMMISREQSVEDEAEDLRLVREARSSEPDWQRDLAATLAAQAAPTRVATMRRKPIWYGAIAASIIAASLIGWWSWRQNQASAALSLLAEAYSSQRNAPFRFPGAAYAPERIERGSSGQDRPAPLLQAELKIQRGLARNPGDPAWQEASVRENLLRFRYEDAISASRRAIELHPGDAAILLDLGLAYFERAESEDRQIDFGTAAEFFSQALRADPKNQEALFNRALTYERLLLYHEALTDWNQYLKEDSSTGWAGEARNHRSACEEKLKQSSTTPLEEDQLIAAIVEWLPKEDWLRVETLRESLENNHNDRLLSSLIQHRPEASFREGIVELGQAFSAARLGNTAEIEQHAARAAKIFSGSGNAAGELLAQYERMYARQRSSRARECLDLLNESLPRLSGRHFVWLEAQMFLQKSSCSGMMNDPQSAAISAAQAVGMSERAGYPNLYMRSLGFRASALTFLGQFQEAWELDRIGLTKYWSGSHSPLRGQQFFYDMMLAAESSQRWNLAQSCARESINASAKQSDLSFEAISRAKLGEFQSRTGDLKAAAGEFATSRQLLAALPAGAARRSYELYIAAGQAQLDGGDRGLRDLESLEGLSHEITSEAITAKYLRVRSELLARLNRGPEAERIFERLLAAKEAGSDNLSGARDRISWREESSIAYRSLTGIRIDRRNLKGAQKIWQRYRSAPCHGNVQGSAPVAPGQLVLSYVDLEDHVALLAESSDSLASYPLALPAAKLRNLARAFAAASADPASPANETHTLGSKLYDAMLGPVSREIARADTLIIEAEGDLAGVSFSAFVTPSGYLSDRFRIVSRPVSGCSHRVPSGFDPARERVLAVAAPIVPERWRSLLLPLADARSEVENLAHAFPHISVLAGREGTASAIEARLPDSTILHFAGHSLQRAGGASLVVSPEGADGADSDDGIWRASRRPLLLGSCKLAVFSACSTAAPDLGSESGPEDLVTSFLAAGVPEVVASRWNVDSAATSSFMLHFYRALGTGLTVPESIQRAARAIHSSAKTAHPYYWAAFETFRSS